jgi:hypothetical protein
MKEPTENIFMSEGEYNQDIDNADIVSEEVYGNSDGDYYFDGVLEDIDFSDFKGKDFKSKLSKVNKAVSKKKKSNRVTASKPLSKDIFVKRKATLYAKKTADGGDAKTTKRIIVPSTQKVIIEGVDDFILNKDDKGVKEIGYYKGKKLLELIVTITNTSPTDFLVNLFDPSMPLDYLNSTSINLNNRITIAGGVVQYSDVLFNILANPIHIPNVKLTVDAPTQQQVDTQINQPFTFINKKATGQQKIEPLQLQLQIDNMQVAKDIVFFDLQQLGRPFIPNGMDVLQYNVKAGSIITFAFFYRQRDIRRLFFKEARNNKKLL